MESLGFDIYYLFMDQPWVWRLPGYIGLWGIATLEAIREKHRQ
jgi:hypothetical protein